jgi:acrylyl-CoA reductase (NADPH)
VFNREEISVVEKDTFRAIVARQDGDKGSSVTVRLESITEAELPPGDVLVDVEYSSLNYKDGLALLNKNKILRGFPIVPGIDFAGIVRHSDSAEFSPGDRVILTGWGVGENWSGGFAERARVKSEWLVKTPSSMTNRDAMAIGTAGLTAMLCISALERAGLAEGDNVVVTGAAGGVGSIAVKLLSRFGFHVTAVTGRPEQHDFLRSIGAQDFVERSQLQVLGRPLQSERWKGGVDTVGGTILANVLSSVVYGGAVAACGLAGGMDLPTTVAPFILRGVSLVGVDSVNCSKLRRMEAWEKLSRALSAADLDALCSEVGLADVLPIAEELIAGRVRGRTVVAMAR